MDDRSLEVAGGVRISRRQLLAAGAATAIGGVAAACAPGSSTPTPTSAGSSPGATSSSAEFDWRRFAGTQITALFTTNPQGAFLESKKAEFEAATGITVDLQIIESAAMRDKQNVEFAAQSPTIDVWHSFLPQEGQQYFRAGWYEDPSPYLADPTLVAPGYDLSDLESALRLSEVNGQLVGIPMWVETQPLYYNRELLDKAGIGVPTTMDELEDAAKRLHAPGEDIYGWATRATSPLNTSSLLPAFLSYGADWLDDEGKASLNTPEAVAGVDWYARMLRLYGPPSPDTVDIARWSDLFKAGNVAFAVDSPSFIGTFLDPAGSAVADKFGVEKWPAGPKGSRSTLWTWSMCIGKFSAKKQAAWYYVMWHTSKELVAGMSQTGVIPSRDSVAESPDYKPPLPNIPEIRADALKNGVTTAFPQVTVVAEARQILGDAVVKAIQGQDVQTALDDANAQFQVLLDSQS
jgi:multiple sugar transport system substrate-binding protein